MSENTPPSNEQPGNGFFINQGTLSGRFTMPGWTERLRCRRLLRGRFP